MLLSFHLRIVCDYYREPMAFRSAERGVLMNLVGSMLYHITWASVGQITADAMGSMIYYYPIEPVEKRFYRFKKL